MSIQTKIKILVGSWLLLALISAGMVLSLNREISWENDKIAATNTLINDIFQLNILTNDYVVNGEQRAKKQWETQYNRILAYLQQDILRLMDTEGISESLRQDMDTLHNIFVQLSLNYDRASGSSTDNDFRLRLIGQLTRVSQELISDAFYLSETSQENIRRLENTIFFATLTLLILLLSLSVGGGFVMFRGVALPVQELAEAKAKADAILGSMGDSLIVVDASGIIVRINTACEQMFRIQSQAVVGKSFWKIFSLMHSDKGELVPVKKPKSAVYRVLQEKKSVKQTMTDNMYIVQQDGTEIPISLAASPIIVGEKLKGAVIVFRDITEEKTIDQAKSEFVSLASHQLQTPLTAAKWSLELLTDELSESLTDQQAELLNEVNESNERMKDLVRDLLNVSRIELGTFMIEPEPTDIRIIARNVIQELQPKIQLKNILVQEDYASSLPILSADPQLLRIVVQNVISNAVKYSPEDGNVSVEIQTAKKGQEFGEEALKEHSITLAVHDSGIGIPKQAQKKIFSKLFRAVNAKKSESEGTGLGLYLAKAIVEAANGMIWFRSEENKGTTFYVTIPLTGMQRSEGSRVLEEF